MPSHPIHHVKKNVTVININCRYVVNKINELILFAEHTSAAIICLTETWLTRHNNLIIPGYTSFRRDRPNQENRSSNHGCRGYGGVAILVKDDCFRICNPLPDLQRPSIESISLDLITKGNSSILGGLYEPTPHHRQLPSSPTSVIT